jgi:hypothetical protein
LMLLQNSFMLCSFFKKLFFPLCFILSIFIAVPEFFLL